jgi:hypothetical protein
MRKSADNIFSHSYCRMAALLAVTGLCGCAAGLADVGGLAQPGNVVTGFMTVRSTIKLNRANRRLVDAQAQLTTQQAIDLKIRRDQLQTERPATVGILKDMARAEHQPVFDDLAQWVAAGGDPNYAMNYALTHPGRLDSDHAQAAEHQAQEHNDTAQEPRGGAPAEEGTTASLEEAPRP